MNIREESKMVERLNITRPPSGEKKAERAENRNNN
jgi:hypothetical protein